jgi:hypothetical protein
VIFRLIVEALRRRWIWTAYFVGQVTYLGKSFWSVGPWLDEVSFTLVAACFLSQPAMNWFAAREFAVLPVSRRTFWLARWWGSVVLPAVVATGAAHLGLWIAQPDGWNWGVTAMGVAYSVLYLGAIQAWRTTRMGRRGDEVATKTNVWVPLILMFGIWFAPFAFGPYLPHVPAEVGPVTALLMIAGAVATLRGFRYSPPILARPSRGGALWAPAVRPARVMPAPAEPTTEDRETRSALAVGDATSGDKLVDRLRGLRLLFWLEARLDLIAFLTVVTVVLIIWTTGTLFSRTPNPPALAYVLSKIGFLPFTGAAGAVNDAMALLAFAFTATMFPRRRIEHMRLLRALPFSTGRLMSTMVSFSVVSAGLIWLVLLVLHLLVQRTLPHAFRPELFLAAIALMTLLLGLRLTFVGTQVPAQAWQMAGISAVGALWYGACTVTTVDPAVGMFAGDALVFGAGYLLIRRCVTRRSGLYAATFLQAFS